MIRQRATDSPALEQRCCADIGLALIVAYTEDTTELEAALRGEGLQVRDIRGPYSEQELGYSNAIRCFVNHRNAWRIAATRDDWTLIVEGDFVPVAGLGALPLPVPRAAGDAALGYLYAVAPQLWDPAGDGFMRGRGGGTVAYVLSARVARMLIEFVDAHLAANPSGAYVPLDTQLGYWLKQRGVQSYLPLRHYGEHGGIPNPEHRQHGLSRPHRADALAGPLAFLPLYCRGSRRRLFAFRLRARAWGWARALGGRLFTLHDLRRSWPALGWFVLRRLCYIGGQHRRSVQPRLSRAD